jgi:hypothetical protein
MRTCIIIMVTMAAREPPLTGADSPLIGSAHRGLESSIAKPVARPENLGPREGGLKSVLPHVER